MKPRTKLATIDTPDGGEMSLYEHDGHYLITVNGRDLMTSRQYESELALATLGCGHLENHESATVLIGGLGMGYTLRQTLDILGVNASVTVGELLSDVVEWNREYLGALTDHPLDDKRTTIAVGDVVKLIHKSKGQYDAILLDVDNGPDAMTDVGNDRLYGYNGIRACKQALRKNGILAIWSCHPCKNYEQRLVQCKLHVRRYRVPAYKGAKSQSHFIWLASENESLLPSGGGVPRPPENNQISGQKKSKKKIFYSN